MKETSFLDRLKLGQKFAVLGAIGMLLVSITFYLYVSQANKEINAAVLKTEGLYVVQPLLKVVQFTQQHRGLSAGVLGGNTAIQTQREAKQSETDQAFSALDAIIKQEANATGISAAWQQAGQHWNTLRSNVASHSITVPESYQSHTALVAELLLVDELLTDHFGLSFDPDAYAYHLTSAAVVNGPSFTEDLGKIRAKGAGILAQKAISSDDRAIMAALVAKAKERLQVLQRTFDKAIALNPALKEKLGASMGESTSTVNRMIQLADDNIVRVDQMTFSSPEYIALCTQAIDAQFKTNGVAMEELERYLDSRAAGLTSRNYMLTGSVLVFVLFSGLLGYLITRGLLRQLGGEPNYAASIVKRIAAGDLTVAVETKAGDQTSLLFAMKVMNESLNSSRTETERMVKEVATIVESAAMGDFSVRMDMTGKAGLFQQLGEGINKLVQTCEAGLSEVVRVLGAMSRGDLTEKITDDYSGTFGQLKEASNVTVEQLKQIVLQIKESTDTITTAAQQIAAGNTDLSQRTEEQASSLEETASSMEELTSTVKQNAENAKQANQLANSASDIAVKGGQVVGDVVQTMASISTSSKKIVDIISVIEGIAFQTNILALNAAVEAARAGEQGRGFAVVASEVRNLAQRSAAAAKEIKTLIGDSVDKVDAGSKQVDLAGVTMNEIVSAVKRVTDIMSEIAAASNEQSAGIEQVNQAISQMDKVTQQNAALVEEAATAAESLREQSGNLMEAVSIFKLETDEKGARARPAIAPHASTAVAPLRKGHRPAKAKESKDGDWKEF